MTTVMVVEKVLKLKLDGSDSRISDITELVLAASNSGLSLCV